MRRIELSLVVVLGSVVPCYADYVINVRNSQAAYNISVPILPGNRFSVAYDDSAFPVIDVELGTTAGREMVLTFGDSPLGVGGLGSFDHFFAVETDVVAAATSTDFTIELRTDDVSNQVGRIRFELWRNVGTELVPSTLGMTPVSNDPDSFPTFAGAGTSSTWGGSVQHNYYSISYQTAGASTMMTDTNSVTFNFTVNVPENMSGANTADFIIRMFTAVPEASSFALGGLALASIIPAGIATRMRKRKLARVETPVAAA